MARFVELMITFTILGFSYFDVISVKYDIVINSTSTIGYRQSCLIILIEFFLTLKFQSTSET